MKKSLLLLFVLMALMTSCSSPANQFNTESNTSNLSDYSTKAEVTLETKPVPAWERGFYVDEFGDATTDSYITSTLYGSFSNSATTNSPLRVVFVVDKAYFKFKLFEYGDILVKNFYSHSLYYDVMYKIGNNVNTIEGWLSSDGYMCFSIEDDYALVSHFSSDDNIKFHIVQRDQATTQYDFVVKNSPQDFAKAYNSLNLMERTLNDPYVRAKILEDLEKLK